MFSFPSLIIKEYNFVEWNIRNYIEFEVLHLGTNNNFYCKLAAHRLEMELERDLNILVHPRMTMCHQCDAVVKIINAVLWCIR